MRKAGWAALVFLAAAVGLGFLRAAGGGALHPRSSGELVRLLGNPVVRDAIVVSLKTTLIAQVLILLFGTPLAYLLATRRFPGRPVLVTLVELPLVLPPAVAGIGLLAALGRFGLLGSTLDAFGLTRRLHANGRRARGRVRRRAVLRPDGDRVVRGRGSQPGRGLSNARCRPGANLLPRRLCRWQAAGSPPERRWRSPAVSASSARRSCSPAACRGSTQTLPLAIYAQFEADFDVALAMGALLVVVSFALLLSLKLVSGWQPSQRTSHSVFARTS